MIRLAIVLMLAVGLFAQTTPPTNLTATVNMGSCSPWLLSCVSQVNGVPVCPYGRVAEQPLPGQPYTILTYPKLYPDGVTSIYSTMCVYVLQTHPYVGDPLFNIPPFYF